MAGPIRCPHGVERSRWRGGPYFKSYARNKNYLPRGEQTEAEFTTRLDDIKSGAIGIDTLEQFAVLLKCVDERFLPFVALGGFAGLRSIEILRLEWTEISKKPRKMPSPMNGSALTTPARRQTRFAWN